MWMKNFRDYFNNFFLLGCLLPQFQQNLKYLIIIKYVQFFEKCNIFTENEKSFLVSGMGKGEGEGERGVIRQ